MMEQETHTETVGDTAPVERSRFWDRIGIASVVMILYCLTVPVLILLLGGAPKDAAASGFIPVCLTILRRLALPAFLLGTFTGSAWVFRELLSAPTPGQPDTIMKPMASLLLTGRLRSLSTSHTRKDLAVFWLLMVLLGALFLGMVLSLLWW
jgi:hypothetical protein